MLGVLRAGLEREHVLSVGLARQSHARTADISNGCVYGSLRHRSGLGLWCSRCRCRRAGRSL